MASLYQRMKDKLAGTKRIFLRRLTVPCITKIWMKIFLMSWKKV